MAEIDKNRPSDLMVTPSNIRDSVDNEKMGNINNISTVGPSSSIPQTQNMELRLKNRM